MGILDRLGLGKKEPEPAKPSVEPAEMIRRLREQALTLAPADIGVAPTAERPEVFGMLMETGFAKGVATLVGFADGTTSLYFSNGGGIIGAGQHESVRVATETWLRGFGDLKASFAPATATPPPGVGRVRFYVRTFGGTLTAEADEQDLGHRRHPLAPLFHLGHAVISRIRETSEGAQGAG